MLKCDFNKKPGHRQQRSVICIMTFIDAPSNGKTRTIYPELFSFYSYIIQKIVFFAKKHYMQFSLNFEKSQHKPMRLQKFHGRPKYSESTPVSTFNSYLECFKKIFCSSFVDPQLLYHSAPYWYYSRNNQHLHSSSIFSKITQMDGLRWLLRIFLCKLVQYFNMSSLSCQ